MKVDVNKVVGNVNQALTDLKQLDVSDWTTEDEKEILEDVKEITKLGLLAKWKVQTAYLKASVNDLDTHIGDLDIAHLKQATTNLEYIVSNIKQLNSDLKHAA